MANAQIVARAIAHIDRAGDALQIAQASVPAPRRPYALGRCDAPGRQMSFGKAAAQFIQQSIAAGVVHHHRMIEAAQCGAHRFQQGMAAIGHDDRRDKRAVIDGVRLTAHRCAIIGASSAGGCVTSLTSARRL